MHVRPGALQPTRNIVSAKQAEDKKRGDMLVHAGGRREGYVVLWPWTARQKRQQVGKRLARKQARKKARN